MQSTDKLPGTPVLELSAMRSTVEIYNLTPTSPAYLAYHKYMHSVIALSMIRYLTPIIVVIGTIGNMLSFAVLMRKPLRRTSIYVYLAVLAWADTAVLYLSAFKTWVRLISGWELLHISDAGCKILTHLFVVSLHMAAWLIVAMSVDRLIVVLIPFKASTWCTTGRAKVVSAVMFTFFFLIHIHIYWKFSLVVEYERYQCAGDSDDYFIGEVFPWLRLVSYSIIPFCVILVLNIIIIYRLIKQRPCLRKDHVDNQNLASLVLQQNKLTVMLLSVSFVWLAFSAPFTIWRLVYPGRSISDQQQRARVFLARTVCFMIMWLNHAVNFALYCLTGKKFRQELVTLVHIITRHSFRRRSTVKTGRTVMRKSSSCLMVERNLDQVENLKIPKSQSP